MSVMYCATFNQTSCHHGFKANKSLENQSIKEPTVTKGEETRQLAPERSSDHVQKIFKPNSFNRHFHSIFLVPISGGSFQ
jgi:hypothetical protein